MDRPEKRQDKFEFHKTLMMSRNGWTVESVRALNIQGIIFTDDEKDKLIHRLGSDNLLSTALLYYLDHVDENLVVYHSKGDEAESCLEQTIKDALPAMNH